MKQMKQTQHTILEPLSFDANHIIQLLEDKRCSGPQKESIDSLANKLGISTSSYKRYLSGDSAPLIKSLETALQVCLYTGQLLFQLTEQAPALEHSRRLDLINRIMQLSPTGLEMVEHFVDAILQHDPTQNIMIFSQKDFLEAINVIETRYHKILKVNLSEGTYLPVFVKNDEWNLLPEEKTYQLQNWLELFTLRNLIHPEDLEHFRENTNLYALKTAMRFTDHDSHIRYRRLVNGIYKPVRMEILKCADYSSTHQTIFMCIRDDF